MTRREFLQGLGYGIGAAGIVAALIAAGYAATALIFFFTGQESQGLSHTTAPPGAIAGVAVTARAPALSPARPHVLPRAANTARHPQAVAAGLDLTLSFHSHSDDEGSPGSSRIGGPTKATILSRGAPSGWAAAGGAGPAAALAVVVETQRIPGRYTPEDAHRRATKSDAGPGLSGIDKQDATAKIVAKRHGSRRRCSLTKNARSANCGRRMYPDELAKTSEARQMYQITPQGAIKHDSARFRALAAWHDDIQFRELRERLNAAPRFPVIEGGRVERGGTGMRRAHRPARHGGGGPDHAA